MINTGATIIKFLMMFLIQNTQNRDGAAVQTKLDEIVLSSDAAIRTEKLTDNEIEALHLRCEKPSKRSQPILRGRNEKQARTNQMTGLNRKMIAGKNIGLSVQAHRRAAGSRHSGVAVWRPKLERVG